MGKKKIELILLEPGETFELNGHVFEVISVSAQGESPDLHHFVYELCLQSEAEEKRAQEEASAAEQRKIAAEEAEAEAERIAKFEAGNPELAKKK